MIADSTMRETVVSQRIDGLVYTSTKWPATEALTLLARTALVLGETGLQVAVSGKEGELSFTDRLAAKAATREGVRGLIFMARALAEDENLPHDLLRGLKVSRVDGGAAGVLGKAFDAHFGGEFLHMGRVVEFVLRHNFLGFTLGAPSSSGPPTSSETTEEPPSSTETPSVE